MAYFNEGANPTIAALDIQACLSQPCQNDGTCQDGKDHGSYTCKCKPGYEGVNCEEDKCSLCDVHAHCEEGKCVCDDGYSGTGTKDECYKKGVDDCDQCDIHAICVKGACRCRIGYKGDGFQCEKRKPFTGADMHVKPMEYIGGQGGLSIGPPKGTYLDDYDGVNEVGNINGMDSL
ncbi:hypothetical protein QZH41_005523 [Actinostola sp. cb2023]|nr:hypothetical protein QZH41_005523 [Actinostola sp. cb2023]